MGTPFQFIATFGFVLSSCYNILFVYRRFKWVKHVRSNRDNKSDYDCQQGTKNRFYRPIYRISVGTDTILHTESRLRKKSRKCRKNRRNIGKYLYFGEILNVQIMREWAGNSIKNRDLSPISSIYRRFFEKIGRVLTCFTCDLMA